MIKKLIHALPVALLLSSTANAGLLWQYGLDGENAKGRLNAIEFSDAVGHIDQANISITANNSLITGAPGYLHRSMSFKQVCAENGYGCQNFTRDFQATGEIVVYYANSNSATCTNVKLTYDRHGTELNNMRFISMATEQEDTVQFGVGGTEGQATKHVVELQDIQVGVDMLFVLEYQGGGSDNGHFIDMIKIEADGCV